MLRQIIKIDEEKCNGCGLCVNACHEGAIGLVDGVAKLLRDDYCDGLGNCLPVCPTGAITFEEREAAGYDEKAVQENMAKNAAPAPAVHAAPPMGCPGSASKTIVRNDAESNAAERKDTAETMDNVKQQSNLNQWPVQIKLVPINAPYFDNANLLIAADCCAYAYGNFHADYMKNKITVIGCPKLDDIDYSEKLTEIIKNNNIKSLTVLRMEVPCCGGIEHAAVTALQNSGKMIPWQVVTISTDGRVLD